MFSSEKRNLIEVDKNGFGRGIEESGRLSENISSWNYNQRFGDKLDDKEWKEFGRRLYNASKRLNDALKEANREK